MSRLFSLSKLVVVLQLVHSPLGGKLVVDLCHLDAACITLPNLDLGRAEHALAVVEDLAHSILSPHTPLLVSHRVATLYGVMYAILKTIKEFRTTLLVT